MKQWFRINAGPMAADNGAFAPLSKMFAIAELLDVKVCTGDHYGQDYIPVPDSEEDKQVIIDILNEEKLIWEIVPQLPYNILDRN